MWRIDKLARPSPDMFIAGCARVKRNPTHRTCDRPPVKSRKVDLKSVQVLGLGAHETPLMILRVPEIEGAGEDGLPLFFKADEDGVGRSRVEEASLDHTDNLVDVSCELVRQRTRLFSSSSCEHIQVFVAFKLSGRIILGVPAFFRSLLRNPIMIFTIDVVRGSCNNRPEWQIDPTGTGLVSLSIRTG